MKACLEYEAVAAGHVCLDITPRFMDAAPKQIAKLIEPGKLVNVAGASISTGGSVSNTGLSLLRLGVKAALMAKIGDDFFGAGIRGVFEKRDAASALNIVEGEETSYSIVLAPPGIDRVIFHHPGANDTFGADDINYDIVSEARLFHLGYPPLMRRLYLDRGEELIDIFRKVKRLGKTTSIDMSLPDPRSESGKVDWADVLSRLLPFVDIAPLSVEEVMFMLDRPRFEEIKRSSDSGDPMDAFTSDDFCWAGRKLLELGAKIAAVKCGGRGILLFSADRNTLSDMGAAAPEQLDEWAGRELWTEAFEVPKVVSATGAGDSAIAGFLAGLLAGLGPEEALTASACVGAQTVQVLDAISGVRSWEETLAMIPSWKKRREQPGSGWTYDDASRVWRGQADRSR